ncbi:hypothetical protein WM40_05525 [Robbsia andropogonis]|uniref:Uncharacterized protein n=1 Tax=Robbsia andropogonis TaxID=28092 RepID=A0A0F5K361_9BURK|nr:hypothetical protein WM40_05525 [Robbsia andropogonis]
MLWFDGCRLYRKDIHISYINVVMAMLMDYSVNDARDSTHIGVETVCALHSHFEEVEERLAIEFRQIVENG